jgi:hypothetical protein
MGYSIQESSSSQFELVIGSPGSWRLENHHSLCLAFLRGLLNFSIVAAGLLHVGCPLAGSLGQALAAGGQSAVLQLAPVNERYQIWLHRAPSEARRFGRWLTVGSIYLAVMQVAGHVAGSNSAISSEGVIDLLGTMALSTVQYPWVTAIATVRARSQTRSPRRQRLASFSADAQTVIISVLCVGASALSSVGASFGRAALLLIGVTGAFYRWGRTD